MQAQGCASRDRIKPPIDLQAWAAGSLFRRAVGGFACLAEPLICFRAINAIHARVLDLANGGGNFHERVLRTMNIRLQFCENELQRIPRTGPVIVVANHPFGGMDGVVLGAVVRRVRPDTKLLVNSLLERIEGMAPEIISVNPFAGKQAMLMNIAPLRESLRWLKNGGLLATFPSGTVSHMQGLRMQVSDPEWATNIGAIIRRTGATVVPVYFSGRNSGLFQILGLLHPRLRTLLLAREFKRRQNTTVKFCVGHPISAGRLARFADDRERMDFLRLKTYIMRSRSEDKKSRFNLPRFGFRNMRPEPIAQPVQPEIIAAELARLPAGQCLLRQYEYSVYYAPATAIPQTLTEIGRLREITFRAAGEGTGRSHDLDLFDQTYIHLFLWNHRVGELVGAYRLGLTDKILKDNGTDGLYTSTLFHYKPGIIENFGPAIELGRSFIVTRYQRKHAPLSLIWRGIGEFVARFPRYRILFGPVSISHRYKNLSRNLIISYLRCNNLDPNLSRQVRAKKPPRSRSFGGLDRGSFFRTVRDIEDVSALVSEIEQEDRGVPVLLRHYLKLNATMLSFNIDPGFNHCVDGLVLVDLTKTSPKTLRRYMGNDGLDRFHAFHEVRQCDRMAAASV